MLNYSVAELRYLLFIIVFFYSLIFLRPFFLPSIVLTSLQIFGLNVMRTLTSFKICFGFITILVHYGEFTLETGRMESFACA